MAFNCTCTCITEHVPESLFSKKINTSKELTSLPEQIRNAQMPKISLHRNLTRKRTFYFRDVKLWYSLDLPLKPKPTLKESKPCIKNQSISSFLDSI